MKTIKQIKELAEHVVKGIQTGLNSPEGSANQELISGVRDNFLPFFQFNIEGNTGG